MVARGKGINPMRVGQVSESICSERVFLLFEMRDMPGPVDVFEQESLRRGVGPVQRIWKRNLCLRGPR